MHYAVLTMVGPGEVDRRRLANLLTGLFRHEPAVPLLVVVDDSGGDVSDIVRSAVPAPCRYVRLANPSTPSFQNLSENTLIALRVLADDRAVEWVLKIDTDAMVISPFATRVAACFASRPEVGQIGRADVDCHGRPTDVGFYPRMSTRLGQRLQFWRSPRPGIAHALWGPRARLRRAVIRAAANGLSPGMHCQGGAYALPAEALRRLKAEGLLDKAGGGALCGGAEDFMTSTLVASTGLKVVSFCGRGEVFGVEARGLPFPPADLRERDYALVHSIKNDTRFSEAEIVRFFDSTH